MPRIAELTQSEYEALPPAEFAAVTRLLLDQEAGRISEASSDNDLTPAELLAHQEETGEERRPGQEEWDGYDMEEERDAP